MDSRVDLKRQLIASGCYLVIIISGFRFIPKEPPPFGMALIPGPLALFSAFGLPLLASVGIGTWIYFTSSRHKGINITVFLLSSLLLWSIAFFALH